MRVVRVQVGARCSPCSHPTRPCVQIDSWDTETMNFMLDNGATWSEKLVHTNGAVSCGGVWNEQFIEKSFTVSHFAPFAWLQWQAILDGTSVDESCTFASLIVVVHLNRVQRGSPVCTGCSVADTFAWDPLCRRACGRSVGVA